MVSKQYKGCVYMATNLANGSIYIGKSIYGLDWRRRTHERTAMGESRKQVFVCALRKYGIENFTWATLYESDDNDMLLVAEAGLIAEYSNAGFRLYNMTEGGEGATGRVLSEASLVKMRGRKISEDQKEKLRSSWTPERRAAQAERMRNRIVSDACREAGKRNIAKCATAEARAKSVSKKTGVPLPEWTAERRAKMKAAWDAKREAGYKRSPETVQKMAEAKKQKYANDPEARDRMSAAGKKGAASRWGSGK